MSADTCVLAPYYCASTGRELGFGWPGMHCSADRARGWARQGAVVRSHALSRGAVTILLGNQMFLNGEKLMSFTPCLRKRPPVYKGHHLEKFKTSVDTVHVLFKKLQMFQVYRIHRDAVCLLRTQKLFVARKPLSFICQLAQSLVVFSYN